MGADGTTPRITALDGGERAGLHIVDPIEQARYVLYTPEEVTPTDASSAAGSLGDGALPVPVDVTVSVETDGVEIPNLVALCLRDPTFAVRETVEPGDGRSEHPPAATIIELTTAPVKCYLRFDAGFVVDSSEGSVRLSFDAPTTVHVGVRSFHQRPAATVSVGDDPADLATALSYFGSALKTTSPERSFPTLRGHPPLVERAGELAVPDGLDRPETGVELAVPPRPEYLYPAAPLAYYLGATVEPADRPRLVAGGETFPFQESPAFERETNRLLRRVFLLDCVARTVGLFPAKLHERRQLEAALADPVDWESLYEAPLAERVRRYLQPRFDPVLELPSGWHLRADVAPGPEYAEFLPFVAMDLAAIRCADRLPAPSTDLEPQFVSEFFRSDDADSVEADAEFVHPADSGLLERIWIGEGYPLGANKLSASACRRRLGRTPETDDGSVRVDIVCNDASMSEEGAVEDIYGLRDLLQYDVRIHYELTGSELATVLQAPTDFIHYIGHVSEEGFRCADGHFDARTLSSVKADAFLLNACRSYEQGEALLDAGCLAGVATLADVANATATRMGRQLARLLDTGLSLRSALEILKGYVGVGYRYTVLGDGRLQLVQSASGCPYEVSVSPADDGEHYETTFTYYPVSKHRVGSLVKPVLGDSERFHLGFGRVGPRRVPRDELVRWAELEMVPVELENELVWSPDLLERLDASE